MFDTGGGSSQFGPVQYFATGGSGVVGGSGGTDSQDVHMALTPGELVMQSSDEGQGIRSQNLVETVFV